MLRWLNSLDGWDWAFLSLPVLLISAIVIGAYDSHVYAVQEETHPDDYRAVIEYQGTTLRCKIARGSDGVTLHDCDDGKIYYGATNVKLLKKAVKGK
jgi:hypothetical protein